MIDQKVKEYSQALKKLGIEHKILEHPDLKTVEEVQNYLGYTVGDSCPALVMKAEDDFVVIIKRGGCQLDSKKLKKRLGVENLRLATRAEFEKLTKLPIGAARVFIPGMRTLLDKKIFEKEYLNGGTGSFTCTFRYKTEDLKKIPDSEIVEVTEIENKKIDKINFNISQEFHNIFPEVNLAMVEVRGVKVDKSEVLRAEDYQYKENFENQKLIKAFQKFYKDLGLGAKAGYPAVENLYRRFVKDKYVPRINNVVDASNKISVQTLIPGGVFDADQIKGDMVLRFSRAGEEYRPLGGGTEALPEGIAVIADDEKILNLFPYRDSIYPKITTKTKNVIVLTDKVEGVEIEKTKKAAQEIAKLLEKLTGGKAGAVGVGEVKEIKIEFTVKGQKKRVFSGTRATGRLHLGNYLGAVKGYIELQNNKDYECIYMAVDVHTITTPYNYKTLSESTRGILLDYMACGLDPNKSIITAQSLVPEHTDLAFLFSSVISVARMQHLPTFKEKVKMHPDNVTMALLNYPLLMAADILIYKASLVPVGIDQEPHLEITREVARKMNELYGMDFPEPKRFVTKGEYVPSLLGEGKMSKSVENSYINLTDSKQMIHQKLAKVPTDSGLGSSIPTSGGVASLLKLVELFEGENKRKEYESQYFNKGIKYYALKVDLTDVIYKELEPMREKYKELLAKPEYVSQVIKEGAERARKLAQKTLQEVKEKMGLRGGL